MTIKAIIFDFGGVLMRTGDYAGRRKWEQRLGLGEWGTERLVFAGPTGLRAELGEVSVRAVWAEIGQAYGLDSQSLAEFERDFWSGDYVDRDLVALLRRLRGRYRLALLSNAGDGLRPLLEREDLGPLAALFDLVMISCEEGIRKPDTRLYLRVVERLGVQPGEAVFVDDVVENVEGARAAGLHGLQFESAAQTIAGLRALGVAVD